MQDGTAFCSAKLPFYQMQWIVIVLAVLMLFTVAIVHVDRPFALAVNNLAYRRLLPFALYFCWIMIGCFPWATLRFGPMRLGKLQSISKALTCQILRTGILVRMPRMIPTAFNPTL
jgi:hypothetical protein